MLTLPKAKTITVTAQDGNGNNKGSIELTTKVGTMIPTLTVPSIIQLIRNTSVEAAQNMKQNTRYVAETKAGSEVLVSKSDGQTGTFTTDPRTLQAEDLEIMVAQFTPQMNGKKYRNIEWDERTDTVQDVLARKLASYISIRRTKKSFQAIAQLRIAADATQKAIIADDTAATTFAKGAHVQRIDLTGGTPTEQAESAYNIFVEATSNFRRIGTETAVSKFNKNYAHVEGINPEDMFIIMSPEFEATILSKPGVFASQVGVELFKRAGIKEILGYNTTSNIALPADVHFMIVTTGMNGTYGYEDVDGAEKGNLIVDPDWSFGRRLDLKDTYTRGVVLPFQVFTATKAGVSAPADPDDVSKSIIAGKELVDVDTDGDGAADATTIFNPATYYGQVTDLTSAQRNSLKKFFGLSRSTTNANLQTKLDAERDPDPTKPTTKPNKTN